MAEQRSTPFRLWRTKMGFSQLAAARRLGYGITKIAEYDRGEQTPPLVVLMAMSAIERNIPPFSLEDAA